MGMINSDRAHHAAPVEIRTITLATLEKCLGKATFIRIDIPVQYHVSHRRSNRRLGFFLIHITPLRRCAELRFLFLYSPQSNFVSALGRSL